MSSVEIKFFGLIADVTGLESIEWILEEGSTVEKIVSDLSAQYPELSTESFRVAVNREIAPPEASIEKGDEVALLPPYAGG